VGLSLQGKILTNQLINKYINKWLLNNTALTKNKAGDEKMNPIGIIEKEESKVAKNGKPYKIISISGKNFSIFSDTSVEKMYKTNGLKVGDKVEYVTETKGQYENLKSIWKAKEDASVTEVKDTTAERIARSTALAQSNITIQISGAKNVNENVVLDLAEKYAKWIITGERPAVDYANLKEEMVQE